MIAPTLRTAPAVLEVEGLAAVLARNAIAAARSVTLRVRAPRRPEEEEEEEPQEATTVEATVALGAEAGAGAVKKHGAFSHSCRIDRGVLILYVSGDFSFFLKLHLWWSRPSIA